MREQRGLGQYTQPPPRRAGLYPIPSTGHDAGRNHDDVPSHFTDQALARADTLYDDRVENAPSRSSVRRYDRALQSATPRSIVRITTHQGPPPHMQRASRMQPEHMSQRSSIGKQSKPRPHWLFYAGLCLLTMLLGWMVIASLLNWWRGFQDDMRYGRPRTFQTDADVGHGGMSHFTLVNLNGHLLITEMLISDPSKAKIYIGPTLAGEGAALMSATLTFEDARGDGFPDMIIHVDTTTYTFQGSKDGFRTQGQPGGNP